MIKCIDVYGQFDNKGTDHYYTYPQALSPESRQLFLDPRADLGAFNIGLNVSDLFLVFCTKDGWWISIVRRNQHDMRQGYAMFSVCLGANRPTLGAEAMQLLRQGYEQFVDQRVWDNAQTTTWLQSHTLQVTPCAITPFTMPKSLNQGNNSAYRTFGNEQELQNALTFVSQKEYTQYSRVFLLPASVTPVSTGHRMPQITTPVKREFTILHSPDTDSSVPRVALEGETIKIVYLRGNMKSEPISYKVGSPSQAAYWDSAKGCIQLNSAQQAGAKFFKHIRLRSNVRKFSLSRELTDNGVRFDEATQTLLVPDNLNPNIKGFLQANGCENYALNSKKLIELHHNEEYKFGFKPVPVELSLVIDGRSYKVDTTGLTQSKVKEWENNGLVRQKGTNNFELDADDCDQQSALSQILQVLGGFFSALVVIYGLYALVCWPLGLKIWPFQQGEETKSELTLINKDSINDDPSISPSDVDSSYVAEDIDYLKKENTWKEEKLHSDQAKKLLIALKNGNINNLQIAHSTCFSGVDEKKINGYWLGIMERLSQIQQDQSLVSKAESEIRRICKSGVINLSELQTALEGVAKPSTPTVAPDKATQAEPKTQHATPAPQPKQQKADKTSTKVGGKPAGDPRKD